MKIGLCRKHFEALMACEERGCDCGSLRDAVRNCKMESERAAWAQLQENAIVQCPQPYRAYASCMVDATRSIPEATSEAREKCKSLWVAMQHCAAEHVVNHIQEQSDRTDGGFCPPPMFKVRPVLRRKVEDIQKEQAVQMERAGVA